MQHKRHFGLERRITAFGVIANLVRPKFSLAQDLMQLGPAERLQRRMTGSHAVLADMSRQ
jgi:hypothetical protein